VDEAAVRLFLETDYHRLVAGFWLLADGEAVAEEAVQEALARAWERGERGEQIESLTAWVATTAANILRSGVRRRIVERRVRRRLGPLVPRESSADSATELRVDVGRAIRALPRRQRETVVLRYFADLDTADVARALGMTDGAVRTMLHRARATLAASLAEPEREEEGDVVGR
jgi:RNA polymerase sigma-70 factor (ECF subfamily)